MAYWIAKKKRKEKRNGGGWEKLGVEKGESH